MKLKKAFAGLLAAAILSTTSMAAFAADIESLRPIKDIQTGELKPSYEQIKEDQKSYFGSFAGKIKEIADYQGVEGSKILLVESQSGEIANIIVSKDTYILDSAKFAVGDEIVGFFDANAPMIMIYPAQYSAEVVAVKNENQNIKVDKFDENLVSADNWLKLNISESTKIVMKDGTEYKEALANKNLVVLYGAVTKSIPAQTTPYKIIVLPAKETGISADVSIMDVVVNQKKIASPAAYANEKGIVMVPLRAIAEALNYEVVWNNEEQSVRIGKGISLKIGEDNYIYMKKAPIKLGIAPEINEGKTFVPLSFFQEVIGMKSATVMESQIIIQD